MAEEKDAGEKTEQPTEQRRADFRKRGQVAQSREVASVMLLFGVGLCIWLLSSFFVSQVVGLYNQSWTSSLLQVARNGDVIPALRLAGEKAAILLLPILGVALLFGIGSSVIQIGFLYNEEALKPNLEKINPINGFKKIFSLRAVVEGLKAVLKFILVGSVAYAILKGEIAKVPFLSFAEITQLMGYFGTVTLKLAGAVGAVMLALALFDYGYQRWELEKQMRMTKQELKEELKNREGDPQIKARIRRTQRELANKRMMESVPKADVIITNPTHIAVAIKYDAGLPAPQVVAKGAGVVAEKIKELARTHNIPILENKPLARTIFKSIKIGQVIPRELYKAVAEVLSYVYKLKRKVVR
ncbi:MAG: flagellar biosynthesis protein FlhB [Bdellovibrionales bacterium]|nr:flagellar biosynthesis protein FlhB [Bdellovibrionales bacterium]